MADLTNIDGTVDIWNDGNDFLADMPPVSGRLALAQRLARRLTTPRGKLTFWPNFGTDLRVYLLSNITPDKIASAAQAECLKDEQVDSCSVTVNMVASARIALSIEVTDNDGPWTFTLTIDQAAATLIQLQTA